MRPRGMAFRFMTMLLLDWLTHQSGERTSTCQVGENEATHELDPNWHPQCAEPERVGQRRGQRIHSRLPGMATLVVRVRQREIKAEGRPLCAANWSASAREITVTSAAVWLTD